jgi:hypothetical protein
MEIESIFGNQNAHMCQHPGDQAASQMSAGEAPQHPHQS